MKVLELTDTRLVIKDGSMWYKESPFNDLLSGHWGGVIGFVVGLVAIALLVGLSSNLSQGLKFGLGILLFFLVGPVMLSLLSGDYKPLPLYVFDRVSGELTVFQGKASQTYPLSEVVDVRADSTFNDDGSPEYWRKVHLVLRSNLVLELHPGHNQPQKQEEMVILIRQFLLIK